MRYDGIGEKQGNTGIRFFISDLSLNLVEAFIATAA